MKYVITFSSFAKLDTDITKGKSQELLQSG